MKNKIVYKGIIVEQGKINSHGDIIDVNGLSVPNLSSAVPVLTNFDSNSYVGEAKIYKDKDILKADLNLNMDLEGWPAIGGQVLKKKGNVIEEFKITSVSICSIPNADSTIKTIKNQS